MADGELSIELIPDEEALEEIEEKQLEISGEPGSVEEAAELNQEQNEKLTVMSRGIGRIASRVSVLAVIAAGIASIATLISNIFNISLADVREAIVTMVDTMVDSIKQIAGGIVSGPSRAIAGATGLDQSEIGGVLGAGIGSAMFGPLGLFAGAMGGMEQSGSQQSSNQNNGVTLMTSREMLTGDATQKEMQSENIQDIVINGGS